MLPGSSPTNWNRPRAPGLAGGQGRVYKNKRRRNRGPPLSAAVRLLDRGDEGGALSVIVYVDYGARDKSAECVPISVIVADESDPSTASRTAVPRPEIIGVQEVARDGLPAQPCTWPRAASPADSSVPAALVLCKSHRRSLTGPALRARSIHYLRLRPIDGPSSVSPPYQESP
jgi:hypothetical protein